MQARRNKILVGVLVTLIVINVGVYVGIYQHQRSVASLFIENISFESIDEVALESAKEKVNLKFSGSKWRVNDAYDADGNMIDVLFATLQQVVAKRSITGALGDSIADQLKREGVRVSLLEQGSIKKIFYVGGNPQKSTTYLVEEGSHEVRVGVIPGYRVYAAGIFELAKNGWRDRLVFGFNWQNFKGLLVEYPNPEDGISVVLQGNILQVSELQVVDTAKLYTFIDNISLLSADDFVEVDTNAVALQNSILYIDIEDIGKRHYTLEVYEQPGSQNYLGLIDRKDWAVFGKNKVLEIKRPRSYFKPE